MLLDSCLCRSVPSLGVGCCLRDVLEKSFIYTPFDFLLGRVLWWKTLFKYPHTYLNLLMLDTHARSPDFMILIYKSYIGIDIIIDIEWEKIIV